jgi:hypothetical protein
VNVSVSEVFGRMGIGLLAGGFIYSRGQGVMSNLRAILVISDD